VKLEKIDMSKLDKKSLWTRLFMVVVIIFLVNMIAAYVYKRFDMTTEKRYSLSDSTKKLLGDLKGKAYVKVYLDGELQSGFLRLRNATIDVLKEMNSESGGKIQYEFVNPIKNAKTEDEKLKIYQEMTAKGLMPINLKVKTDESYQEQVIFPCIQVNVNGQSWPVQILENQVGFPPEEKLNHSIISLEYKISNAIKKLTDNRKYTIGIMQGHDEYKLEQMQDLTRWLTENKYEVLGYDVRSKVQSKQGDSLGTWFPQDLNLMIIARPMIPFTELEKYRLDQYVMRGGKILWAIDGMDAKMDYMRNAENLFTAQGLDLNLDDLFFKYGVRINHNLVQDAQQSAPIPIINSSTNEPMLFPWLFHPMLTPSYSHPIGKNLDPVYAQFASGMDLIQNDIKKTAILTTSQYSRALPEPVRVHLAIVKDKPDYKYFKQSNIACGVLLEGKFQSAFKNRLESDFVKQITAAGQAPKEVSVENKMIVLSDADILRNDVSAKGEVYPLGYEPYSQQTFANRDFMLNCIEYLIDPNNLLETRNKEIKLRLLDSQRIKEEGTKWQFLNLLLPFVLVLSFAIIYNYMRKRKWTTQIEPK
jgi:ABC-2 type transport system permease protein